MAHLSSSGGKLAMVSVTSKSAAEVGGLAVASANETGGPVAGRFVAVDCGGLAGAMVCVWSACVVLLTVDVRCGVRV